MDTEIYRFKLGDFECFSLSDGSLDYPLKNLFANVPMAQIEEALRQHSLSMDYITMPYACLFINTSEHRVLVDMGAGRLGPRTGRLLQNMEAADIDPAGIDTVFITHAHTGHIGGALNDEGKPVYVNARYFMWKDEWRFWTSEFAFTRAPERFVIVARENLGSIQDRLSLVEHETEILPGIRAIPAPGHTPGHMVALIFSGDEQLMYISDTVLYPLHLEHPDWVPIYDIMPEEAAASKRRIFDRAAAEKVLVMGSHFPPFPSLGYVVRKGEGWQWQPVETMD